MFKLRLAEPVDGQKMLDIYAPVILETATSFEYKVPTLNQFQARVAQIQQTLPWLVITSGADLAGYAYAGPHRSREAYQWSTELSVYINPDFQRRGIGRVLYEALVEILKLQGYYTALAGITLPNSASVKFHESLGFTPVGVYKNVGYKFDCWHSVGWWEYPLRPYELNPEAPLSIENIRRLEQFDEILHTAANRLNKPH